MREQIVGGVFLLCLAGCGGILPHETNVDSSKFLTYEQVLDSYSGIQAGKTRLTELPGLGLDTRTTPNIEAQYRCSAYVFHLQHSNKQRSGGVVPDLLGIEQNTVNDGWSAEIILLLQDDVVVYKVISGSPHTQDLRDKTQPLGPFQDLGRFIMGSPPDQNN